MEARVDLREQAQRKALPHRGECLFTVGVFTEKLKWLELLDWAVYHAPGWIEWQEWRKEHEGRWKTLDVYAELRGWLATQPPEHRLQDLVRTVNIARSLRGIQKEHPEVVAFREEFTPEMDDLWKAGW